MEIGPGQFTGQTDGKLVDIVNFNQIHVTVSVKIGYSLPLLIRAFQRTIRIGKEPESCC